MDNVDNSFLLIVPSSNTSCSVSVHSRTETMTYEQFMSAISAFQLISNAETAEQGTQVTASAPKRNNCAQTTQRKLCDVGCDPCSPKLRDASTSPPPSVVKKDVATHQVTHTVDVRTQTIKTEEEAIVKVKVEKRDVGVGTCAVETREIGVDATIKSGIALPIPRKTVGNTNLENGKETKSKLRIASSEGLSNKLNTVMEHIDRHMKQLQKMLNLILNENSSEQATLAKRYLHHIAKVVSEFPEEDSDLVIRKDERWMNYFKRNPLWSLAAGTSPTNCESSDGEICSDEENTKKNSRLTGVAASNLRSNVAAQTRKSEDCKTKRRRFEERDRRGREIPSRSVRPRLRTPPRTHRSPPSRYRPHMSPPRENRSSKHHCTPPRGSSTSPRERLTHSRAPPRDGREARQPSLNEVGTHLENLGGGGAPLEKQRPKIAPLRRTRSREEIEQYKRIKTVEITKRDEAPYRAHYPERLSPQSYYPPPRSYPDPSYFSFYSFPRR